MKNNYKKYFILSAVLFLISCFVPTRNYVPGQKYYDFPESNFTSEEEQFSSGEPYMIIDGLGHYLFSLPAKLLLWNWNFANHSISDETKNTVKLYFRENGINDVKVRFNEYAPFDEMARLWKNKKMNPFMKYTLGLATWIIKTVFPERLFAGFGIILIGGGDYYDPYTDTVNIFSGSIPIALHEAGHAKDFSGTKYPASYSILRIIPFATLYQEGVASQDAIEYLRHKCMVKEEEKAYRQLPPAYTSYLASSSGLTNGFLLFALPGHMVSIDLEEDFSKKEIPECGKVFGKNRK